MLYQPLGPYLRASRFQGDRAVKKKRYLFPGAPADVAGFAHVAVRCHVLGSGMLTRFPFDGRRALRLKQGVTPSLRVD